MVAHVLNPGLQFVMPVRRLASMRNPLEVCETATIRRIAQISANYVCSVPLDLLRKRVRVGAKGVAWEINWLVPDGANSGCV